MDAERDSVEPWLTILQTVIQMQLVCKYRQSGIIDNQTLEGKFYQVWKDTGQADTGRLTTQCECGKATYYTAVDQSRQTGCVA